MNNDEFNKYKTQTSKYSTCGDGEIFDEKYK